VEVKMRSKNMPHICCLGWLGLALIVWLGTPPAARADDPMLAIRLADGESAVYALAEVELFSFASDTALVVVAGSGSQVYATETIVRIEFLWDLSSVADPEEAAKLIKALHLFQNQPNPFSPETRIGFELPQAGQVELKIYAPDGRLVRALVTGERSAGRQEVSWDGRDDAGRRAAGGVYFYSLRAPGVEEGRRMIMLP
jgi:hypothetical protein